MSLSRERLKTPCNIAMIRLFTSMNSKMCFEITFLIECSLALFIRTDVFFLAKMSFQMNFKSLLPAIRIGAPFECTLILFDLQMSLHMIIQMAFSHKRFTTALYCTRKWPFSLLQRSKVERHKTKESLHGYAHGRSEVELWKSFYGTCCSSICTSLMQLCHERYHPDSALLARLYPQRPQDCENYLCRLEVHSTIHSPRSVDLWW